MLQSQILTSSYVSKETGFVYESDVELGEDESDVELGEDKSGMELGEVRR